MTQVVLSHACGALFHEPDYNLQYIKMPQTVNAVFCNTNFNKTCLATLTLDNDSLKWMGN